jgi:hypothetical protein
MIKGYEFQVQVAIPLEIWRQFLQCADPTEIARKELERQTLICAGRGQVELDPLWSVTQVTRELQASPFGGLEVVLIRGLVLGARQPCQR